MNLQQRFLTALAVSLAATWVPSALGLVALEDGNEHIFVDGSVGVGFDSNLFANSQQQSSSSMQESLELEFNRRAGWIGVNATAALLAAQYSSAHKLDYVDPKVTAEFSKQTGRTTGSLTFDVQRIDRADINVNTRDSSWTYDVGLNFQYPVIDRYSFAGSIGYDQINYDNTRVFTDLTTYLASLSLYYIISDARDFFVTYRNRVSDERTGGYDDDNALLAGVSGKVVGPFNGSLQVGYETRTPYSLPGQSRNSDLTASSSVTWNIDRRDSLTADLSKDFAVTANAISVNTEVANLGLMDSFSAKDVVNLGVGVGRTEFLGNNGLLSPGGPRRRDTFFTANAAYTHHFNQHVKIQVNYVYFRSWSNLAFATFPRQQWNLFLTVHW